MQKYISDTSVVFKWGLLSVAFLLMNFSESGKRSYENHLHQIKSAEKAIYISSADQKMYVLYKGDVIKGFSISTSKYGLGFENGSMRTPTGMHMIRKKIGEEVPLNGIFNYRKYKGEKSVPDHPDFVGKDLITTRILWLEGSEEKNKSSFKRCIYIHGTPEEAEIGKPASHGCIRMRNVDIYAVFEFVDKGTPVYIE